MANFRKELLAAIGVDKPDAIQALLIDAAERYHALADRAYQHVLDAGDSTSSNSLGAGNQFIKSTTELLRILKLLGLVHPSAAKQNQKELQDFFRQKVVRGKK